MDAMKGHILCDRRKRLTKHHLVPREVHSKKRYVNRFGKKEMRQRGLMICKECHNGIHDLISNERNWRFHKLFTVFLKNKERIFWD